MSWYDIALAAKLANCLNWHQQTEISFLVGSSPLCLCRPWLMMSGLSSPGSVPDTAEAVLGSNGMFLWQAASSGDENALKVILNLPEGIKKLAI